MTTKIRKVCPQCGSEDICMDAAARWDILQQDWVLTGVHEGGSCDDCGAEIKEPDDVEIPD